jgi:hypothetical protein
MTSPIDQVVQHLHSTISLANHNGWHINFHHDPEEEEEEEEREHHHWTVHDLALTERIRHFTWSWYTMTMATGGIANVLYVIPSYPEKQLVWFTL